MNLIGQCPVVIVTARHGDLDLGMPVAWIMGSDYDPPRIAMTLGKWNSTYGPLVESKECVINVASKENARLGFEFGSCHSNLETDKFAKFGVARTGASLVRAPLVDSCFASLECRVEKADKELGLFILKGVKFWLADDYSPERYHLLHSLGDVLYSDDGEKFAKKDLLK